MFQGPHICTDEEVFQAYAPHSVIADLTWAAKASMANGFGSIAIPPPGKLAPEDTVSA